MTIQINPNGIWYHGSYKIFDVLEERSTITQWKALAAAFSYKPKILFYTKSGKIFHTGIKKGHLYIIDEPVAVGKDIYRHPRTVMDKNAEFLTRRPLKVKLLY